MRPRHVAADYAFLDHPGPLAFAHRGGSGLAVNEGLENSMRAFQAAIDLGYRYLETDAQVTADGVAVVLHDATLERTTGRPGTVADLTYDQLREFRIGGREPVPRLSELLGAWPQARVNVDIKTWGAVEPVVAEVRRARAHERVCLAAFSERRIRRVRRLLGPAVATACGPASVALLRGLPGDRVRRLLLAAPVPCVQVPRRVGRIEVVTPAFVRRAHELGKQVHVWTVDEPAEMRLLLERGVDGLISDRIDLLRDVLAERGQWQAAAS